MHNGSACIFHICAVICTVGKLCYRLVSPEHSCLSSGLQQRGRTKEVVLCRAAVKFSSTMVVTASETSLLINISSKPSAERVSGLGPVDQKLSLDEKQSTLLLSVILL